MFLLFILFLIFYCYSQAPAPSGGFNFGAGAPPVFNPEAKPTFNFTGNQTANFS